MCCVENNKDNKISFKHQRFISHSCCISAEVCQGVLLHIILILGLRQIEYPLSGKLKWPWEKDIELLMVSDEQSTDLASKWHITSNHNLLARSNHIVPSTYRWLGSAIILDVQKLRVESIWWTELTSKFGICRHHIQDITRKHGRSEKRRDTKGDAFYLQCSIFSESKGKPVWNMAKYWDLSELDDRYTSVHFIIQHKRMMELNTI